MVLEPWFLELSGLNFYVRLFPMHLFKNVSLPARLEMCAQEDVNLTYIFYSLTVIKINKISFSFSL